MEEKLTMEAALQIFNVNFKIKGGGRSAIAECPVCKKKKMYISLKEDVYNCFSCNEKGGALSFWALMRGLPTSDMKEVAKDYYTYCKKDGVKANVKKKVLPKTVEEPTASVETRNKTYSAFLSLLTLSEEDMKDLLKRGLTKEQIAVGGYKTYPIAKREEICENLLNMGMILKGVPGFYINHNKKWDFIKFQGGYLIPQRDGFGRIQGMQIRVRNVKPGGNRYFTISSYDYNHGAKGNAHVHFSKGRGIEEIILTEGPLKADLIKNFTGITTLGIQGVNSIEFLKYALKDLKKKGLRRIIVAFDMDIYENEHVEAALKNLEELITDFQIPYSILKWDREYKGLDDWLLAQKERG